MKVRGRFLDLFGVAFITSATGVFACVSSYIGDGDCDEGNNTAECGGYDGGDCCECTCVDATYECGSGLTGFSCEDPEAVCEDEGDYGGDTTYFEDDGCVLEMAGDGYCDQHNNFAECGGYACVDPEMSWCADGDDYGDEQADDFANLDGSGEPSSNPTSGSSGNPYVGPGFATGLVTIVNLLSIRGVKNGNSDEQDLLHSKLLVLAWLFSIAEGIVVLLAVPDSKESLKIGIVFLFSFVAAASGFSLRKAGRYGLAAILNAILEGGFAAVFLFFFVGSSTRMVFLMGGIAGNQALVGFAIAMYVEATTEDPDSDEAMLCIEVCFILMEAIADAIFPLTAALILSLFHPNSPWRSDFVFTWWGITGFANLSLVFMIMVPPMNRLGYGLKLLQAGMAFFNGTSGIMAFVIYDMTRNNIEDPPEFDIIWSIVTGSFQVYIAYCSLMTLCVLRGVPDGEIMTEASCEEDSKQS
eukprot:g15613.t1